MDDHEMHAESPARTVLDGFQLIKNLTSHDELAIYLGPAFAASLLVVLSVLVSGRYMQEIESENRIFLVIPFACLLISFIAEIVYMHAKCSGTDLCFRIEIASEESSGIIAILSFLTFQHRESFQP